MSEELWDRLLGCRISKEVIYYHALDEGCLASSVHFWLKHWYGSKNINKPFHQEMTPEEIDQAMDSIVSWLGSDYEKFECREKIALVKDEFRRLTGETRKCLPIEEWIGLVEYLLEELSKQHADESSGRYDLAMKDLQDWIQARSTIRKSGERIRE